MSRYVIMSDLKEKLEAGFPGATVLDARNLLYGGDKPYKGKDHLKSKCIYLCLNRDTTKILECVKNELNNANLRISENKWDKTPITYKIKHFNDITNVILSGSTAHSVVRIDGSDLRAEWEESLEFYAAREKEGKYSGIVSVEEIRRFLARIDDNADYVCRRETGATYRCTMYSSRTGGHIQANVGNVLILSGENRLPDFAMSPPRKSRERIYDTLKPDTIIGYNVYYKIEK